jgi:hypothetical protein
LARNGLRIASDNDGIMSRFNGWDEPIVESVRELLGRHG